MSRGFRPCSLQQDSPLDRAARQREGQEERLVNRMGKPGIPRYVAVLKGMDVCSAKANLAEHDAEYWRAHPKELQELVARIRAGMRALHEAGQPEWGTATPVDAHRLRQAEGWKPGSTSMMR